MPRLCLPAGRANHRSRHCVLIVCLCLQITKIRYVYRDANQDCNLTSLAMGPGDSTSAAQWQSRAEAFFECIVTDDHGIDSPPTAFSPSIDTFEEWFLNACRCRPGVFFNPNKEGTKGKQVCHGSCVLLLAGRLAYSLASHGFLCVHADHQAQIRPPWVNWRMVRSRSWRSGGTFGSKRFRF